MKNPNIITRAMSKFIVSCYIAYIPALAVCIAATNGIYVPLWIHCLAVIAVATFLLSSLLVTVDEVGLFFGGKLRVATADTGIQTITATSGCVKKIRQRIINTHRRIIPVQLSQAGAIGPSLKAANTRAKGRTSSHSNGGAKKPTSSGDDSDGGGNEDCGYTVTAIKPINTQSDLADLVGKSKKTIQNIASNSPNLLPPAVYLPTSRAPLYLGQDIITWFLNHRAIPAQKPKRIGRPRIAVQLGLTKKGGA
ncbi:MAG: hypothetical protein ACYCR3_12850 [Acidithiobacillus sp.]